MADEIELEVRQIEPGDRLTGLSLGQEYTALKTFLQRHAHRYHAHNLARTYAAFDSGRGKVVAYITLVCGEVCTDRDDHALIADPDVHYRYKHYPAVKIARLAVDTRYREFKIGKGLIKLSLGIAKDQICPAVGCRFVVVDSKRSAVPFYEKQGFTLLDTTDNKGRDEPVMFVDLHKVGAD